MAKVHGTGRHRNARSLEPDEDEVGSYLMGRTWIVAAAVVAGCCVAVAAVTAALVLHARNTAVVVEDSLSVRPSSVTTTNEYVATLVLHATRPIAVQAVSIAVREGDGSISGFPGLMSGTLSAKKVWFTTQAHTFSPGTYTYFGRYEVNGHWKNLPAKRFTVGSAGPSTSTVKPDGVPGSWTVTFDDEFNEISLGADPNWSGAGAFTPLGPYTWSAAQAAVSGGDLVLTYDGSAKKSGIVSTAPGYATNPVTVSPGSVVEARIELPAATDGAIADWPQFWTDGQNYPVDGSIEVLAGLGGRPCFHIRNKAGSPGGCDAGRYAGRWATFDAYWETDGTVEFFRDGVKVGSEPLGTTQPQYIVLDLAVGDGGQAVSGSRMLVDYVRTWRQN